MNLLSFFLAALVCYYNVEVVLAAGAASEYGTCTRQMSLRFANFSIKKGNGTILGRVLVCEDNAWRNLCDTDWTLSDAKVACRTFQYSPIGAQNIINNVVIGGVHSRMEVKCNGSENHISDCEYRDNGITANCMFSIELQCFHSNYSSVSTSIPMTLPNTQQHTQLQSSVTNNDGTIMNTDGTTPMLGSKNSSTILKPPDLYYFIVGLAAVVIAVVLLALVVIFCCYGKLQSREISPYNVKRQNGFTKEKNTTLHLEDLAEESTGVNSGLMMHHQLQQSGPVYDGIQSSENSSTPHSQENLTSRSAIVATNGPPLSPQSSELYSLVNSTDTYFQLEMHIPTTALTRAEPPNSDSDYQQLDHKTSSLKRDTMSTIQAVNRSAVAVQGEFLEQKNRTPKFTSHSFPRDACLSSYRPPLQPNRSLERPNLEVQLRVDDDHSSNVDITSDQENFYQTIDSPPDYASLKELDEGSEISTNSNRHEKSVSNPLKCHSPSIPECPNNSGPVPSMHTSSHSSRTCSISSSKPQISRALNDSPLVSRDYVNSRIMDYPELRNKQDCNCPKIAYPEIAKPNRFQNHSDGYTFTLV